MLKYLLYYYANATSYMSQLIPHLQAFKSRWIPIFIKFTFHKNCKYSKYYRYLSYQACSSWIKINKLKINYLFWRWERFYLYFEFDSSQARHVLSSVSTHLAKGFTSEIEVLETKENCARALPDYLCRCISRNNANIIGPISILIIIKSLE